MPLPLLGAGALWAGGLVVGRMLIMWAVRHLPALVGHGLAALGLYLFVGQPASSAAMDYIVSNFSGVPGTVAETLYYLNVDDYVSIVISAYTVRAAANVSLRRRAAAPTP